MLSYTPIPLDGVSTTFMAFLKTCETPWKRRHVKKKDFRAFSTLLVRFDYVLSSSYATTALLLRRFRNPQATSATLPRRQEISVYTLTTLCLRLLRSCCVLSTFGAKAPRFCCVLPMKTQQVKIFSAFDN